MSRGCLLGVAVGLSWLLAFLFFVMMTDADVRVAAICLTIALILTLMVLE